MNVCIICQADGVLQMQGVWYCRQHAVDGVLTGAELLGTWEPLPYITGNIVRDAVAQALYDKGVHLNDVPQYYCGECDAYRFSPNDCYSCGCDVEPRENEDEEEDEDADTG